MSKTNQSDWTPGVQPPVFKKPYPVAKKNTKWIPKDPYSLIKWTEFVLLKKNLTAGCFVGIENYTNELLEMKYLMEQELGIIPTRNIFIKATWQYSQQEIKESMDRLRKKKII